MLNISTQTSLTVGAVSSPKAEFGSMLDESNLGAKNGTKLAARWFQDLYYALYAVIQATTGTVTDAVEDTDLSAGVQDFLTALKALGKLPSANPFMNYALFRDDKASGVHGQNSTAGAWTKRNLTEVVNNIPGCSIASDVITLLAGTYAVKGYGITSAYGDGADNRSIAALFKTDSSDYTDLLVRGSAARLTVSHLGAANIASFIDGTFTLSTDSNVTFRQYTNQHRPLGSPVCLANFGETYASLELWKLD